MNFNKYDRIRIINTEDIWENKEGTILADFINDEISEDTEEYLVKVFFEAGKTVIQPFNRANLELAEEVKESLTEAKENSDIEDFIHNYVYLEDINDNEVDSWFFVDKIAAAENITSKKVIEVAKKLKYKLFSISQNQFKKIIVASPKCAIETIYNEYADYLLGDAEVVELSDKGEK